MLSWNLWWKSGGSVNLNSGLKPSSYMIYSNMYVNIWSECPRTRGSWRSTWTAGPRQWSPRTATRRWDGNRSSSSGRLAFPWLFRPFFPWFSMFFFHRFSSFFLRFSWFFHYFWWFCHGFSRTSGRFRPPRSSSKGSWACRWTCGTRWRRSPGPSCPSRLRPCVLRYVYALYMLYI